jgi:alpha-glucosidase (family GH31 glycosyl hydrolase)
MSLIKYYHTELTYLHLHGGSFFKPLFFEFPDDPAALDASQELNVMLGSALKLGILSNKLGQDTANFTFPAGTWCDVFNNGTSPQCMNVTAGNETKELGAKAYNYHVHLREGFIIPMQNGPVQNKYMNITNTYQQQDLPIDLHIHPSCNSDQSKCVAQGRYINDDGVSVEMENNTNFYEFTFDKDTSVSATAFTLNVTQKMNATDHENGVVNMNDAVNSIQIYNAAALGIQTPDQVFYDVKATMLDDSEVVLGTAVVMPNDRLVFLTGSLPGATTAWLPQIKGFSFSVKA